MFWQKPTLSHPIYKLFLEHSNTILQASKQLDLICSDKTGKTLADLQIQKLENKADQIGTKINSEISKSFILPLDKEDFLKLIERMDDVMDSLERLENRLYIYKLKPNRHLQEFAKLTHIMAINIEIAITQMSQKGFQTQQYSQACISLNQVESIGDINHRKNLAKLMSSKQNPVTILKWHDIYKYMEETLDKSERLAGLLELISVKYS
jgi:uncharacterized protein